MFEIVLGVLGDAFDEVVGPVGEGVFVFLELLVGVDFGDGSEQGGAQFFGVAVGGDA